MFPDDAAGLRKVVALLRITLGIIILATWIDNLTKGVYSSGGISSLFEYIFDENGIMENAGFLDYRIPVASDLPMIDTQIIEVPNPSHPYGVRGVGETPIVAPLAAASNAVSRSLGQRVCDLPMSPPNLLAVIDG